MSLPKIQVRTGDVIAIPVDEGFVGAKVLFASNYFKDVILVRLATNAVASSLEAGNQVFDHNGKLFYTSAALIRNRRWLVVGRQPVTAEERSLSKRTSGGELWLEDTHLGAATEADLQTVPKMLVHGGGLIEKHAATQPRQLN